MRHKQHTSNYHRKEGGPTKQLNVSTNMERTPIISHQKKAERSQVIEPHNVYGGTRFSDATEHDAYVQRTVSF